MKGFAFVLTLALVPAAASAQEAPVASTPRPAIHPAPAAPAHPGRRELGKWWKDSEIAEQLRLTPAQVNQIEASFLDYRLKLIDLRADLERQETKLQPLIEADQPDEAKVSAQLDLVVGARGKLEKANTMMMLAMRRALSPEQWRTLQGIQESRARRMPSPAAVPAAAPMPPHVRPPDHPNAPRPARPPNGPEEDEEVSVHPFAAAPLPPIPR